MKKKKKGTYWHNYILADWCKALSFLSTSLRKCCWDVNHHTSIFLPTFPSPKHAAHSPTGQNGHELELKVFFFPKIHLALFVFKTLRNILFSVLPAGTKSRGRIRGVKNKRIETLHSPREYIKPGFNCKEYLEGQICYCLIARGVRGTNASPSAKWMWNAARSNAKEYFEPVWHRYEW